VDREKVAALLEAVASGTVTPAQALARLRDLPVEDLRFARVDVHRSLRHGVPEAIFCQGKTPEQVVAIRASAEVIEALRVSGLPCRVHDSVRLVVVNPAPSEGVGLIVVVSAGTSDQPVAEEAALTAEAMGNAVERLFDCGVAGLHRLVPHLDRLNEANAIIAVAGMEGALPTVLGGLVDRPVIAVPTSVGYGASLGGIAALLAMLNSCAPGVSVVNIDNGYGAAAQASQINKLAAKLR
jgi:pyridinium-3,5-biscarboxylic acid mononucleotide synthase